MFKFGIKSLRHRIAIRMKKTSKSSSNMSSYSCPSCLNNESFGVKIGYAEARLFTCRVCGTQFHEILETQESLARYYDKKYSHYLKNDAIDGTYLTSQKVIDLISEISKVRSTLPSEEIEFIELGSSFPILGASLLDRNLFAKIFSIEPSSEARQWGDKNGVICFSTLNEFASNIPSIKLRIVVANHVLEHLIEPAETVIELARICEPGSILIGAVPNGNSIFFSHYRDAWEWFGYPDHLTYFSPIGIILLLERSGWKIMQIKTRNEDDDQTVATLSSLFQERTIGNKIIENLMVGKEIHFVAQKE